MKKGIQDYISENLRHKRWRVAVTALACVVVFCTTYSLILPAITMTGETYCGKEEHTHTDECYEKVLICGYDDAESSETPLPTHTHTDDCYETEKVLVCTKEESEGHTHSETCYDEDGNLICGLEESEGHTHDDSCYQEEKILICGQEETVESSEALHVHTDACYENKLICDKEEHTHTLSCYSNPDADKETSSVWESTIPQNLGDNWAENVVAVAKSQLGYKESTANYTVLDDGVTTKGYTRYGEWYSKLYDDWDAMFSSFCLNYAGVPNSSVPYASVCSEWVQQLINSGIYSSASQCEPETGYLVFFDNNSDGTADHVGVVSEVTEDKLSIKTIEGDVDGAVAEKSYSTSDGNILGYCVLPKNPNAQEEETSSEDDIMVAEVLPDEVVDSGTFEGAEGNEMTWAVTKDDDGEYTLTISGDGPMADYVENQTRPWESYSWGKYNLKKIVIGDGVTKIGNFSLCRFTMQSIEIADTVKTIGKRAFYYCLGLEDYDLNIPGTVKEIQTSAFAMTRIKNVILNEGTEIIADDQFFCKDSSSTAYIPSTVKSIGTNRPFNNIGKFVVDENNPYFTTDEDGNALFNKDKTTLYGFTSRHLTEYRIPNTVTRLNYMVFETNNCDKLIIPTSVRSISMSISGNIKEIIFEDGTGNESSLEISGYSWGGSNSDDLVTYHLPQNRKLILGGLVKGNWPNVTYFEIPNGVTSFIANLTDGSMLGLETLRYNAKSATFGAAATAPCGTEASFGLVIGNEVDTLAKEFSYFVNHSTSISFEPNNQITIADGAFDDAPAPLKGLSGTVYVDSQGVVYSYDASEGTAKLVYVPDNVSEVTIPETITPEDGVTCKVTTVGSNALCLAQALTSITFDTPEIITDINTYGLANCPTLASVNGKTTIDEAKATFTNAKKGYGMLDNTGLKDSSGGVVDEDSMDGEKALVIEEDDKSYLEIKVSAKGETLQWKENEDGGGGYTLLTGDTLNITAAAGNTQGNTEYVYRVYLKKDSSDCVLNVNPGESYSFNDNTVTCYQTDDPNIVYLEFVPGIGTTLSFPVTAVYSSPTSKGGGLSVWGEILTASEAEDKTAVRTPSKEIEAYWKTKRDPYKLTKTVDGTSDINITSTDDGTARPASNLIWNITLDRDTDTTSAYGKDIVKSVNFTDELVLPTGFKWSQTVLDAAKNGKLRTKGNDIYIDNTIIASLTGTNWTGRGVALSDDGEDLIFRWKCTNSSKTEELGSVTGKLTIYPVALEADTDSFKEDGATLTNTAKATVHYTYSKDAVLDASVDRQLIPQKGELTLTKTAVGGYYFGEDVNYTVKLKNTGLTDWTGTKDSYLVRDELSKYSYISAENLEKMFADEYGDNLTVTIKNATLAQWQNVTSTDGGTSYKTSANSNLGDKGKTLTIKKSDGGYTVSVNGGSSYSNSSLAQALKDAGYAVSVDATYICEWALDKGKAENLVIHNGAEFVYKIYATYKDTFGMITKDWPGEYNSSQNISVQNNAYLIGVSDNKETKEKSAYVRTTIHRESVISKSLYDENNAKLNGYTVSDGAVFNYQLDFTHYGSGEYDNLPMVDDLYGSQYLLVRTDLNPSLADKGLATKESDGVTYYILTEGEYSNVVVGEDDEENWLTANSITVTKTDDQETEPTTGNSYSGIHTQIKWYFSHLDGGHYRKSVRYQAVEDLSISGVSYSLGNVVWMNDRTNDRIYASISWGNGTLIDYDKSIVDEKGDTPSEDILNEDDYSIIASGDKVTYRLALINKNDAAYTISGKSLVDMLPETYDVFTWEKGTNITMEYVITGNVEISGLENWSLVDASETAIGLTGGRQCITWPEDTQIKFQGKSAVYMYVTLAFPSDTEDGDVWSQYVTKNSGAKLDNTFYVYRNSDKVEHDLKEEGKALLQKGVLSVVWYQGSYRYMHATGTGRQYYANKDGNERVVFYYVALYNGGNTRMYLSDLQDKLPEGFTFLEMEHNAAKFNEGDSWYIANGYSALTNEGKTNVAVNIGDDNTVYRRAYITAKPSEDLQSVTFSISGYNSQYALKYDEKQQQYYLDHGEALVFSYAATVGTADETEDTATNTIAMPYTDHLSSGVTMLDKDSMSVNAVTGGCFTDLNDGDRRVMSGNAVEQQYGFTGEEKEWLVSSVSLQRGGIVPGITKHTESYTNNQSGVTYDYKNSVGPNDTVNWRVRVQNTGTASMTDYTVSDIMPKPYKFTGDVKYSIYDSKNVKLFEGTFFSFTGEQTDDSVTIKNVWGDGKTISVPLDGTETWLKKDEVSVSISTDEKGNEVLSLHVKTLNRSVPESGYMDLSFSSVNPTNSYTNSVYVNQASVTPNQQTFTNAGQGSIVRDESGKPVSVRNSSPVTVTFGYATSSEKSVTEIANDKNTAVSTDVENNWIMLPSENSEFRYTLTVNNDTDKAMTKLVLIDNLPEVGDHSPFDTSAERNSEFNVNFADNPDIQVNVTTEDGTTTVLDSKYYTVEYSTSTDFGGQQSDDWKGADTGKWTSSASNARSLRIIITDPDGAQLPAKATIKVSFNAVAADNVEPGKTAWNSYGYHYGLIDTHAELEAMPLVVGVKTPSIPTLVKQLVNDQNQSVKADEDASFRFLVYEGEALNGYNNEKALKDALDESGRKYMETTLTVKDGKSESETEYLRTDSFNWTEGKKYTVTELDSETEKYHLSGFVGADKTVTFTYHAESDVVLTCRNTLWRWSLNLIKVDGQNTETKLQGAVFALYSTSVEDKIDIPNEYKDLDIRQEISADESTLYLCAIKTTDENGNALWDKLSRDSYYLLEVKAPDGYNLPKNAGQFVKRSDAVKNVCTVSVQNTSDYELPKTGGIGTSLFTVGGIILLLTSMLIGYVLRHRGGRRLLK